MINNDEYDSLVNIIAGYDFPLWSITNNGPFLKTYQLTDKTIWHFLHIERDDNSYNCSITYCYGTSIYHMNVKTINNITDAKTLYDYTVKIMSYNNTNDILLVMHNLDMELALKNI